MDKLNGNLIEINLQKIEGIVPNNQTATIHNRNLMIKIKDKISGRLQDRGLMPVEIARLIKDVSNATGGAWYFTISDLRNALERLGWEEYVLDNYTLELIFLYLNDETVTGLTRPILH